MMKKVTIQEIADFTGVSKFAVSRALSGKSGVSTHTREMIIRTAGQLGYFKDQGRTAHLDVQPPEEGTRKDNKAILVLFPNVRYQNMESVYWGPVFNGISSRLNQKGIDIITLTEPTADSMFSLLNPQAIGGIITVGSVSTQVLLDIRQLNIPVMMVDHLDPAFQCDMIFSDNLHCIREIMMNLIRLGCKSFQFVGPIKDAHSFNERWLGFRSTLIDCGLEQHQIPELVEGENEDIKSALTSAAAGGKLPEVLVCINDWMAEYVIDILKEVGVEVPADVQVTGFDNTHPHRPILATVNVNKEQLGRRAVDQLLWRMHNPQSNYEKILVQADVLIKDRFLASSVTGTGARES
ncbi:LacI family DNA-binding transcriptional regulator [Paenibacillus lemnae]|uniref:LacI family transcriptional regulator n=1 Tax=Paenibacillus lemnae TaxID=1330551 RepID=A0A848M4F0_PAELE|nr:LacI family DNA-binding transcriptional regulator [Paenibacillus lemnae]NMO95100.1 LacI family transcriptional regulator [Paenibacillus lemnae]